jgi:hypothetical protein
MKTTLHSQVRFILFVSAIGLARLISPDLPGEAVEQGFGARERVFGGRVIALIHIEPSFAQGCFNAQAERDELRMQDRPVGVEPRVNGIGGTEIGGRAGGHQDEMMASFALVWSFLSG